MLHSVVRISSNYNTKQFWLMLHSVVRISSNYNTKHNTIVSATVTTIFTCVQCTVHEQSLAYSVQCMRSYLCAVYVQSYVDNIINTVSSSY